MDQKVCAADQRHDQQTRAGHKPSTREYIKKLRTKMVRESGVNQQQDRSKAVAFDTVHVRQHERIVLTNGDGPALLGLGWGSLDQPRATPVDFYERSKPPPRENFRVRGRLSMLERSRLLTKYYGSRDGSNVEKPKKAEKKKLPVVQFEGLDVIQEHQSENRPKHDRLLSDDDEDSLSLDALGGDDLIVDFGKDTSTCKQDTGNFHDAKSTLFSSVSSLFESLAEEKLLPVPKELEKTIPKELEAATKRARERLHLRQQQKRHTQRQVVAKGA